MSNFVFSVQGDRASGQDVRPLIDQFVSALKSAGLTLTGGHYTHEEPVTDELFPPEPAPAAESVPPASELSPEEQAAQAAAEQS